MPDRRSELVDLFVRNLDQIELPPRDRWRPAPRKDSYFMKTSRFVLFAGAVAAVLVAALLVGVGLSDRSGQVATPPAKSTSTPLPPGTPSPAPTAQLGSITGRISYPSDFIPPVTVYAIGAIDQRIWYSVEFPGYGNPPQSTAQPGTEPGTYTLTGVAPGEYWVVAYRNDGQKPDPGLHTREAVCLRRTPSGPCPDQAPNDITVTAGQTTREIDIVSWWPGSGLMPPPPPRPTAQVTPAPGTFENSALGYRIRVPDGYRRYATLIVPGPDGVGVDFFTVRTDAEERAMCVRQKGSDLPPREYDTDLQIRVVSNASGMSAVDYANAPNRRLGSTTVQATTINGLEAAKVVHQQGDTVWYLIRVNDRMYEVGLATFAQPSPLPKGWLDQVVATFTAITPLGGVTAVDTRTRC